jgi:hypothetical protein
MLKRNTHSGTTVPIAQRPRTRLTAGVCAVVLASTLCVGLTACSDATSATDTQHSVAVQTSEHAIAANFTTQLESLTAQDIDDILNSEGVDSAELSTLGIDEDALAAAYLEGFDFSVENVQVNGNFASATFTLSTKSPKTLQPAVSDALSQLAAAGSFSGLDADASNQLIGQTVLAAVEDAPTVQTAPITVSLTNENGSWTLDQESQSAIFRTIMDS